MGLVVGYIETPSPPPPLRQFFGGEGNGAPLRVPSDKNNVAHLTQHARLL